MERLSHSKCECKYHIIWIPKYRRKIIYGQLRQDIIDILKSLCAQKAITIIEGSAGVDHIHMLVEFSSKYSVAYIVGYLKGRSAIAIFNKYANLKYKFGNQSFWAKGYFASTAGVEIEILKKYIRQQENADMVVTEATTVEYEDPFKN